MSYICANCIGDLFLRGLIESVASSENPCEYCERNLPAADIWSIVKKCDEVLETFYELSSQARAVVRFDRTPAGSDLQTTIQKLVQAPPAAIEDIVDCLSSMWYDRDSEEQKYGDEPWFVPRVSMEAPLSAAWSVTENSLRREARYLNPQVAQFMESIFGGIVDDVGANGSPVLVDVFPGSASASFYRARVFESEASLKEALQHPERYLGAPLAGVGRGGRMNAAGQPAFYGATHPQTAIAEVRPPVDSWVTVAKFSAVRPLKLLDLTVLRQVRLKEGTSLFDPATKAAVQRRDFLRVLCEKMVAPVMPESQDRNYLITQVVADYLATYPRALIDGMRYPSVQRRKADDHESIGMNVVLFHKAAATVRGEGAGPSAFATLWDDEDYESAPCFRPTIRYLPAEPEFHFTDPFRPKPALQLIPDSIQIHRVRSIDIQTDATPISVESV